MDNIKTKLKTVNFYIDGFNFYYGLKRMIEHKPDWKKFYWIDLVKLCNEFLIDGEQMGRVVYFTARPNSQSKVKKQNTLLYCNTDMNPGIFSAKYGRHSNKEFKCKALGGCKRIYEDIEEKETDVNLAIQMIVDAYDMSCDKMVLISGDTDFVPPLKIIKKDHKNIETMILFPAGKQSNHLTQLCNISKSLETQKAKFNKARMEKKLTANNGKIYEIPESWVVD